MHKYAHIINFIRSSPLAIMKSKMVEINNFLLAKANGAQFSADEVRENIGAAKKPRAGKRGTVAVLDVFGVMQQRVTQADVSSGGLFSVDNFKKKIEALAADDSVKSIVLNIDSPGGSVFGVEEAAQAVRDATKEKHVVAVANSLAASAAYWIASQADEVVITPSGQIGSIGVFTVHEDWSANLEAEGIKPTIIEAGKFKTEGTFLKPLTEEAIEAIQADVDFYYDQFTKAVAKGRGTTAAEVRNGYGEGRVVNSKEAVKTNLADRIATFDEVLESLGVEPGAQRQPMQARTAVTVAQKKLKLLEQ
jgi:capsid assembly protease